VRGSIHKSYAARMLLGDWITIYSVMLGPSPNLRFGGQVLKTWNFTHYERTPAFGAEAC
jgi:hypothetical protein